MVSTIKNLYNKNCLDILKETPKDSIDTIITDPPYLISRKSNFDVGGAWNDINDTRVRKTPPKTDFGKWDKVELDWDILMSEFYRILKPSGTLLIFYDIWKMQELKECAERYKFKQPRLCRWDKTNPIPINSKLNYLSNSSEYFATFVKGGKPTFNSDYDKGIYTFPVCSGKERTAHPTQKPLALMNELVLKHSNENDLIFDPFMGSGSTGIAAVDNGRQFIGCELDTEYFKIALDRFNKNKKQDL